MISDFWTNLIAHAKTGAYLKGGHDKMIHTGRHSQFLHQRTKHSSLF